MSKQIYRLVNQGVRDRAKVAIDAAEEAYIVTISEPTRSLELNAKLHAMFGDLAKSGIKWMGKERTAPQWKVLCVSGHAVATGQGVEMIAGLEGEVCNVREETSKMSNKRASSLVEYILAWGTNNGVEFTDPPCRDYE